MATNDTKEYEIIETRYQPNKQIKLGFLGTFEQAKKKALEDAKKMLALDTLSFVRAVLLPNFRSTI